MTRRIKNAERYRRGNTTSGEGRKGWRGGRVSAYPPGTDLSPVMAKLSSAEYAIAVLLGDGFAAKGVRRALILAAPSLPPGSPQTRDEALEYVRIRRKSNNNVATVEARYKASLSPADLEEWEK
jgi:hypothetical protein